MSVLFALLGTVPKGEIAHFIGDESLDFRLVAMACCFQSYFSSRALSRAFVEMQDSVGDQLMTTVQLFVCCNTSIASVASIIYSSHVDSVLWRCEYPKKEIADCIYTCNKLAAMCQYDFEGERDLFALWQSLNTYLSCIQIRKQQGIELNAIELQQMLGIDAWLLEETNNASFKRVAAQWDLAHLLLI